MSLMDRDDFEIEGDKPEPIKPLFTVEKGEATSKWMKNAFKSLMKRNQGYFEEIRENLKLYKGKVFDQQKSASNSRLTSEDPLPMKARHTKLFVNQLKDLVDYTVNTLTAKKSSIDIGPANVDFQDRIAAQVARSVHENIEYQQDGDMQEQRLVRGASLAGEHYLGVLWNPDIGDLHPDYVAAEKSEEGVEIQNSAGEKEKYKGPIRIGDVEYKHFPAWKVLPEPVDEYEKVTWHLTWDTDYIDCVKLKYKKKRDLVTELNADLLEGFDSDLINRLRDEGKTIILTLFAKRSKYLPEGRLIVFYLGWANFRRPRAPI
jgi:hypothetical protein